MFTIKAADPQKVHPTEAKCRGPVDMHLTLALTISYPCTTTDCSRIDHSLSEDPSEDQKTHQKIRKPIRRSKDPSEDLMIITTIGKYYHEVIA